MAWRNVMQHSVTTLIQRYRALSASEKNVALAAALLALCLVVYALLQPAWEFSHRARASLEKEQQLLQTLEQHSDEIRRLNAARLAKTGNDTSLLALASKTATEQKLTLQRYEPGDNGRLSIWLSDAEFNALLTWLDQLTKQYQVHIDRASITAGHNPGRVEVQVQLRE